MRVHDARSDSQLDLLPAELLHRIAIFLPCSSILNVCFTSRRLYQVCYDRAVFKHSAVTALFDDKYDGLLKLDDDVKVEDWELETYASETTTEESEEDEWMSGPEEELSPVDEWDLSDWGPDYAQRIAAEQEEYYSGWPEAKLFDQLSAGASARIAYAVEKARSYFNISPEDQISNYTKAWEQDHFREWLPHLIALRHIVCLQIRPETSHFVLWEPDSPLQAEHPNPNPSVPDFFAIGFCLIALMLLKMERVPRKRVFQDTHIDIREPFWTDGYGAFSIVEDLEYNLEQIGWDIRAYDIFSARYTVVLYMLFTAYPFQTSLDSLFPSLHRIPFATTLETPIPFLTSGETFTECNFTGEDMINFLLGEWTGWCTDQRHHNNGYQVSPGFRNLNLVVRASKPSDSPGAIAIIDEASHGDDLYGFFSISGTVTAGGEVWMTKSYPPDVNTYESDSIACYRGMITPFGIAGPWGIEYTWITSGPREGIPLWKGFFWIWKKEWCR